MVGFRGMLSQCGLPSFTIIQNTILYGNFTHLPGSLTSFLRKKYSSITTDFPIDQSIVTVCFRNGCESYGTGKICKTVTPDGQQPSRYAKIPDLKGSYASDIGSIKRFPSLPSSSRLAHILTSNCPSLRCTQSA
jgi:hypothetical protein